MANKYMARLRKLEGAVTEKKDVFAHTLLTTSPSADFVFGKTHGLPLGYSCVFYGPPKGGKSVLSHMMIGWLHQSDPDAIAIKFDTEGRADGQLDDDAMKLYGIDPDRLVIIQTNSPKDIFDQIEKDIAAQCQDGAKIRLVIIDSVSSIQGRRDAGNDSVEDVTIGDHAQTVSIGLKRILFVLRRHDIALVLVCQARAEMDTTEQKRGNKFKMQAGWGLQHFAEYFLVVEKNQTVDGRKDILGNEFINEDLTDLAGKGEQTAIKIRVKMKDSSMGPKGRTGEFTFDFHKGVVNQFEEVFKLGCNRNIITRPNQLVYEFGGKQWKGKEAMYEALKNDPKLCAAIIAELKRRDAAGEYEETDKAKAARLDAAVDDDDEDDDE